MAANLNSDIRAAIESKVADIFPTTPTAWHNVPFSPPNALWIHPIVTYGGEGAIAHSNDQLSGAFVLEIFAPLSQGDAPLLAAIATAKTNFYRKRISDVYIQSILAVRDLTEINNFNGKAIDFAFNAISNF